MVKPYKSEFGEERSHYLKKYEEVLKKVQDILEDNEVIESIMKKYNKDTETKEEYKGEQEEENFGTSCFGRSNCRGIHRGP